MRNGKGSTPRPTDRRRYGDNYDRIFGTKGGQVVRRTCDGMYVATDVDQWDEKNLLRILPCLTHEGEPVRTIERVRELCEEGRANGWKVFPLQGCTHVGPDGRCQGWEERR